MTGPFLSVQESKLYGPTWINVARIVKIQQASKGTTIFLDGAGMIQIDEPAQTLLARLEQALAEQAGQPPAGQAPTRAKRASVAARAAQHG